LGHSAGCVNHVTEPSWGPIGHGPTMIAVR
jgi:hypothetical protein